MLAARDVMRVLQNHPLVPIDLRQKALRLAGRLLPCDSDIPDGVVTGVDALQTVRIAHRVGHPR